MLKDSREMKIGAVYAIQKQAEALTKALQDLDTDFHSGSDLSKEGEEILRKARLDSIALSRSLYNSTRV